jgi:hypothetical protein
MNDLERLVAIEGLRSLQARYVRYADAGDWRALAGLFLPDAQFTPYGMDGRPQMVMTGPAEIEQRVSGTVGSGTARHHLFSYEIDVDSLVQARGLWAMEDWIDRGDFIPAAGESEQARGLQAAEDWARADAPADAADNLEEPGRPFRTMHGYGYYQVVYRKVDGLWFIADLKLFRTQLDFTY